MSSSLLHPCDRQAMFLVIHSRKTIQVKPLKRDPIEDAFSKMHLTEVALETNIYVRSVQFC